MSKSLFLISLFLFFGCSTSDAVAYQPQTVVLNNDAFEMQTKVNALRQTEGAPMLQGESKLMEIAKHKAEQMYFDNIISHSDFDERFAESGATYMGECLSYNYQAVSSEFTAYVNSKSHQKTLINAIYSHMGYWREGKYGCLIVAGYQNAKNKTAGKEYTEQTKQGIITTIEIQK